MLMKHLRAQFLAPTWSISRLISPTYDKRSTLGDENIANSGTSGNTRECKIRLIILRISYPNHESHDKTNRKIRQSILLEHFS